MEKFKLPYNIYKVKKNERSTCFCICERSFCFCEKTTDDNQRTTDNNQRTMDENIKTTRQQDCKSASMQILLSCSLVDLSSFYLSLCGFASLREKSPKLIAHRSKPIAHRSKQDNRQLFFQ